MSWKKTQIIADYYKTTFDELLRKWYIDDKLSGEAIAEKISLETGVRITSRAVYLHLHRLGFARTKSEARNLAIATGRMDYSPFRKAVKSIELRKGISLAKRYQIMKRDNFRCVLCGQDAKEAKLVIDHIIPVTHGGTNDIVNLRTTCGACNYGKKTYEHEK